MNFIKIAAVALITAITFYCGSCSPAGSSTFLASSTSAANNHIMLVRGSPPTFGFQRLAALSARHPDLAMFVDRHGMPDFLAETSKGDTRYIFLYNLRARTVYACRTGSGAFRQMEFTGPHPVTDNEFRTLSKLGARREVRGESTP